MADDLTLRALIESALDAQGFEEFKSRLEKAAGQAQNAAGPTQKLGGAVQELGRRLPNAGLGVMADAMLRGTTEMTGAHKVALSLANVLGNLSFVSGGVGVAVGVLASVVGLAINAFNAKAKATDEAADSAKHLQEVDAGLIQKIDELRAAGVKIPPVLARWTDLQRQLNSEKARGMLIDKLSTQFAADQEIRALQDLIRIGEDELTLLIKRQEVLKRGVGGARPGEQVALENANAAAIRKTTDDLQSNKSKLSEVQETMRRTKIEGEALAEAMREGASSIEELIGKLDQSAKRDQQRQDSLQQKYESMARRRISIRKVEGDEAIKNAERTAKADQSAEEVAEFIRQQEETRERERRRQDQEDARKKEETEQQKLDAQQNAIDQGVIAAGVLMGREKEAAIVMAIISTYRAAAQALHFPPGPPVSFAYVAAAIAMGLAQVAKIREQKAGFDLAESDFLARYYGTKWAGDLLNNINRGFMNALSGGATPGMRPISVMNRTVINRGTTIQGGVHLGGFFGANETELLKRLNRRLVAIQRLENRTRLR